jgi:ribonuclease HI
VNYVVTVTVSQRRVVYHIFSNRTKREVLVRIPLTDDVTEGQAEYRSVIDSLVELGYLIQHGDHEIHDYTVEVRTDSNLVTNQALGIWKVQDADLIPLHDLLRALLAMFKSHKLVWIPRARIAEILGELDAADRR